MNKYKETFESIQSKYGESRLSFIEPDSKHNWRLISVVREKTIKYEDYSERNYRLIWENLDWQK